MQVVKNKSAILANYKRMREQVAMSEALVLDLIAHPESTPKQIAEVREKLIDTRKKLEDVWRSVDKLFVGQFVTPQPPHHIEMRRKIRQHRRDQEQLAQQESLPAPGGSPGPSM